MLSEETEIVTEETVEEYFEEPTRKASAEISPDDMQVMADIMEKLSLVLEEKISVNELQNFFEKTVKKQQTRKEEALKKKKKKASKKKASKKKKSKT